MEDVVCMHDGLCKAESSVLVHACMEKIGLRHYLFQQCVPEVVTPLCSCLHAERETAEHLVLRCNNVSKQQRTWLQERAQLLHTGSDFVASLQCTKRARLKMRWILGTGCLQEYMLAVEVMNEERQRDGAQTRLHHCSGGTVVQQDN